MKVLIIEDELPAARQLTKMLAQADENIKVIEVIDSVEASVKWLNTFPTPDAVFMDIQIADGLSFDIFNHVEIPCPVVFTTAFDQYAIKAFKVNAIDYLLKPIDEDELQDVLDKIVYLTSNIAHQVPPQYNADFMQNILAQIKKTDFKERFLIKQGQNFISIETIDIAYFFSEDGLSQFYVFNNKKYLIENTLDELETVLNPKDFLRINRKMIVNLKAIQKISPHFNGRLKLELMPVYKDEIYVARERVTDFKAWLGA
jgi:two-component system, LytTR family, response regulator LytT